MWQSAGQTITSAIYILFASPIASSIGPGNWYNLGAGLATLIFVFSIFLVPETKYHRSLVAYGQITDEVAEGTLDDELKAPKPVRLSERPAFDYARYPPRTIWSDMRLFVNKPDWSEGLYAVRVSQILSTLNPWSLLTVALEHVPGSPLPERLLGLLHQRVDDRSQYRYWDNLWGHHRSASI